MFAASSNLVVGSIVMLGIAGFCMAITVWSVQATWIVVATGSFLLLIPLGLLIIGPRLRVIDREAREAAAGPLPEVLAKRTCHPALALALAVYLSLLLGIVFLMTANSPPHAAGLALQWCGGRAVACARAARSAVGMCVPPAARVGRAPLDRAP